MVSSLLSVLAVMTVGSRFDDPDMWWHMKVGQIIWTTHRIPTTDTFSFTTNHHAWIPHEWLSQLTIYAAYRFGGYSGLMVWLCAATAVLFVCGYALCSLYSGNAKVGFAGAMAIWFFSTTGLAIRPQMIGYLLLIVELIILHLGRTRDPRWFFVLPPLFAVWVNCHGSFFLGLVVAAAVLACSFFEFEAGSLVARRWGSRPQRMLGYGLLLSIPALFINPVGWRQVLYPLDTMLRQPVSLSIIQEWMPPHLNSARGLGLLVALACIALLVIVRRTELLLEEVVIVSLGTWLAISHTRMLFVFGILVAPVVTRLLSDCWESYDPAHDLLLPNAILIATAAAILWLTFPSRPNLAAQTAKVSPVRAVDYIQAHHLTGNMLNEYVYGGYLIWAAPEHPVFVDGRGDVFEWTGVLHDYVQWEMLQTDPKVLLSKYNIGFCLLARSSAMTRVMQLLPGWQQVYSSKKSVIFVRKDRPSNAVSPRP